MVSVKRIVASVLVAVMCMQGMAQAQFKPDVWRDFAGKVEVGSELKVRLADGTRFRATLVRVDESGLVLQPRTRVPVPLQTVAYDAIAELEPTKKGGVGVGKAVAIGLGIGAGAFWGMVGIALLIFSD
jgi:hypothetical protein